MSILFFSEYIKSNISSITEDIAAQNITRDIVEDRDELLKQVVELVGSASESGIQIQIGDITTKYNKAIVKVLIGGAEHSFTLEDGMMSIDAPAGGLLDGVKGKPYKVLNILLGIKDGNLSEK